MKIINKYILVLVSFALACNSNQEATMLDNKQFFVKCDKTEVIDLCGQDKVSDLELAICDKTGIKPKEQLLSFNGKLLNSDKLLLDYNITEGSFIELLCKLFGGTFKFADLRKDPTFKNFSNSAPSYRTLCKGLNLEGTCHGCGKNVWIQKGIGNFDIKPELVGNKCPNCGTTLKPKNIKKAGMYSCSYTSSGVDDEGDGFKKDHTTKNNYAFDYYSGNLINWMWLKINTKSK